MNLGQTIYRLRMEKNMSQGDLADALGVSRQSVSKWETNSSVPELDKLISLGCHCGRRSASQPPVGFPEPYHRRY